MGRPEKCVLGTKIKGCCEQRSKIECNDGRTEVVPDGGHDEVR